LTCASLRLPDPLPVGYDDSLYRGFIMSSNASNCALVCSCSQRGLIPPAAVDTLCAELATQGWQTKVVPDLCEMATQTPTTLRELAQARDFLVAACRPRAARWLLHLAGVARPVSQIQFQDLRPRSPAPASATTQPVPSPHDDSTGVWPAWFPVIDYGRCTGCRQCVSFCAFGVYSVAGKEVLVTAPSNCKDNCPACARICPTLAIMFPKVADTPINGDEVTTAHVTAMADARRAHTGGNLQSVLAARRARQADTRQALKTPPPP
jgi:NAD-dependent dihydropyrimidine dehydrogenase PreA subunit